VDMARRLEEGIDLRSGRGERLMHGDFCFSNILYDSRVRRIRAIDPRGLVGSRPTIFGDTRYDLAKLSHSILGRYDQIVAGRRRVSRQRADFEISFEEIPCQPWLAEALADLEVDGVRARSDEVTAVMVSLFLSMLPLHGDRPDRQAAFIANALRLYLDLDAR